MLTIAQATAILSILLAFGVDQRTIDNVHDILIPPIVNSIPAPIIPVQVIQTPVTQDAPVYFGSVNPTPAVPAPVVPVIPDWTIKAISTGTDGKETLTAKANVGMLHIRVEAYDKNGVFQKEPITVTTNDPDLPSSFVINAPLKVAMASGGNVGFTDFFCVAPNATGQNGCPVENPVSIGTFDITFTIGNTSKTIQVTITP